jgi:hypothetical protein
MNPRLLLLIIPILVALLVSAADAQEPRPAAQNPSPMVETTRAHERLVEERLPGWRAEVEGPGGRRVSLFVPDGVRREGVGRLLIHFHGAAWVAERAVVDAGVDRALAVVNLGAGSGGYDAAFDDPAALDSLLARVHAALGGAPATLELSAFSAGHGAVRAILREPRHFARVDGVLLLDGLHAGYDPPRTVLAEGGRLRTDQLESILRFAEAATRGEKRLLITHSTIFPGTFASTTETADHLLAELGLRRTPVLEWGPMGMQLLSRTEAGGLRVLGFAGNSAPDHIDHLHGMGWFLGREAWSRCRR